MESRIWVKLSWGCQTSLGRSCSSEGAKRSYSRETAEIGIASRASVFRDGRKCWAVPGGGSSVLLIRPGCTIGRAPFLRCGGISDGTRL